MISPTVLALAPNGPSIDDDDLMIITTQGVMIRQNVYAIRIIGRNTQGVRLLRLDDNSKISSVTKVIKDPDESSEQEASDDGAEETPTTPTDTPPITE